MQDETEHCQDNPLQKVDQLYEELVSHYMQGWAGGRTFRQNHPCKQTSYNKTDLGCNTQDLTLFLCPFQPKLI